MHERFKSLEGFGEEELEMIQGSKIAVLGLGATGSVIAESLARIGAELVLIDRDYLEPNDCYSSQIYTPEMCEKALPKAEAASEYLSNFTEAEAFVDHLNPGNISMLSDADLVMDGTDNLETRFLISEYCRKESIPWIYTAALAEKGFSMLFRDKCFNCVFDQVSPGSLETCETSGIMREVSTIAASISSRKAVKLLAGKEVEETLDTVSGRSLRVEDSGCEVCRDGRYPHLNSSGSSSSVCGENKYQIEKEIDKSAFDRLKQAAIDYTENDYLARAELGSGSFVLFRDGRAIIEARDRGHAEAIYSETIGV